MKKRILYNLLCVQPQGDSKFHGGGEYGKTIFKLLVEKYIDKVDVVAFYNKQKYLDEWLKKLILDNEIKTYHVEKLEQISSIFLSEYISVYYTPITSKEYSIDIPSNIRKVATIHGLRNIEMPVDTMCIKYGSTYEKLKSVVKLAFKKKLIARNEKVLLMLINTFDDVICASNHTAYGFRVIDSNIKREKIHVEYSPEKYTESTIVDESYKNEYGKYILLLGGNRWLKNPYRPLIAITELLSIGYLNGYRIIVVGKIDAKFSDKYIRRHSQIINIDYVKPSELENLYYNCKLFIYPTLNEGFGSPPFEAMKYGKTCLISCICSLPEVYQDSVYYMNPYDIREIKNRILNAIEKPIDKNLIKKRYDYLFREMEKSCDEICKLIIK